MNIFSKMKIIKKATEECISRADTLYGVNCEVSSIKFRWLRGYYGQVQTYYSQHSERLQRTEAHIYYGFHTLLSSKLYYTHMLKNTVPHEVAHVVNDLLNGEELDPNKWHNEEWLEIFKTLGGTDARYLNAPA